MKLGMILWKADPLNPKPFSPVHSARKFSQVFGTTSKRSCANQQLMWLRFIDSNTLLAHPRQANQDTDLHDNSAHRRTIGTHVKENSSG